MHTAHTAAQSNSGHLRVAELAARAGVTPSTIRHYARVGLLRPGRDAENGYRMFNAEDVHRVSFIRDGRALGLTLGDMHEVLAIVEQGTSPCRHVHALLKERLRGVATEIVRLQRTKRAIEDALIRWSRAGETRPQRGEYCPLIERVPSAA